MAAPPLVEAGCGVVALDAPGSAGRRRSRPNAYALDRLAGLCRAAADALSLSEPVLAGHSWGGAVVVAAAALRPHDARAVVLLDGGHTDPGNWPDAQPEASFAELLAMLAAGPHPPTWDALAEILAESGDGQEWTLAAWRQGVEIDPRDASFAWRAAPETLVAARMGLVRERLSDGWRAIAAAGHPDAPDPGHRTRGGGLLNERLPPAFAGAVPEADVLRPGCRHQVLADLGVRAGELVADWLRAKGLG